MSDERRELAPNLLREAEGLSFRVKAWIAGLLLTVAAFGLGWAAWPEKPVPEVITAAPEMRQADNSVIAERRPQAKPSKPPHMLPKGSIEERRGQVVASPALGASSVEVDYSLARMPDGGRRVIVSSPDGAINSALDIPIEAGLVPAPAKPWAAGLSYGTNRSVGLWIDRDIGARLRVGAAIQRLQDGKAEGQVRVGVRW